MIDLGSLEQQYGLPQGLLASVRQQESNGDPNAINTVTATGQPSIGAFQFQPATAKQYGINPLDENQAAQGAAMMLGDLSKKYNGDLPSILAGYNWGQGNLDKQGLQNAPAETKKYIQQVSARLPQVAQNNQTMSDAIPEAPTIEVELPNGKIISDVPANMSKADLMAKLSANGIDTGESKSFMQNVQDVQSDAGQGIRQGLGAIGKAFDFFGDASPEDQKYSGDALYEATKAQDPSLGQGIAGVMGNTVRAGLLSPAEGALRTAGVRPQVAQDVVALGTTVAPFTGEIRAGIKAAPKSIPELMRDTNSGSDNVPAPSGPSLTSAQLRQAASQRYGAGEEQGAQFQPKVTNSFLDQASDGILPKSGRVSDLASDTPSAKLLNNLQDWRDTPMSLSEVLDLDKHIGNLADNEADSVTGHMSPEGVNLLRIQQHLRDTTMNAPVEDMVKQPISNQPDLDGATKELQSLQDLHDTLLKSVQDKTKLAGQQAGFWRRQTISDAADDAKGLANVKQQIANQQATVNGMQDSINNAPNIMQQAADSKNAVNAITQGRQLSAAAFKKSDLERIAQRASNANNPIEATKQGYRALANNESRLKGYTTEERAAIQKAAKTGALTHLLNVAGSNLNPILAAEFGGPLGAAVGYAVSRGARSLGGKLQANRGAAVSKLIDNRPSIIEAMKQNASKE